MLPIPRSRLLRYGVAILAVVVALILSLVFRSLFPSNTQLVFLGAVALGAYYGRGPGLLATILSVVVFNYYFTLPRNAFVLTLDVILQTGLFATAAFFISALQEGRKHTEELAFRQGESWRVTLASIGDAVIATDMRGYITLMNTVAEDLTGWKQSEAEGKDILTVFNIVNEETRQIVDNPIKRVLSDGNMVGLANHTILISRNGTETPIDDSGAPIKDSQKNTIGAVLIFRDITARYQTEKVLRASETRFRTIADNAPVMIWMSGTDTLCYFFNKPWLDFTGRAMEQELGTGWNEGVHPDDLQRCLDAYLTAFNARENFRTEYRLRRADGEYRWVFDTGIPQFDADGVFTGYIGSCLDITERKRSEDIQHFLADAGTVLASSLNYETTLQSVADLAVPELADWCAIQIVDGDPLDPDGITLRQVAVAHIDPSKVALAHEWQTRYPPDPRAPGGIGDIIRTRQSQLIPDITDEMLVAGAHDEEHLQAARSLSLKSLMQVPIIGHSRVLGTIAFIGAESNRHYVPADLDLAEELARRAALAIENSQLYAAAQHARRGAEQAATRIARSQSVTAALSVALTSAQVCEVVISRGLAALGAAAGSISLLTEDHTALEVINATGYRADAIDPWRRIPLDMDVPITQAIKTGRPVWINAQETQSIPYSQIFQADSSRVAWASIPLIVDERAIGAMALSFVDIDHFDEEDQSFMLSLAQTCAQALDRARLYEAERVARDQAERATARVTSSQNVTAALSRALTVNEVAQVVVDQGLTVLGAVAGMVGMLVENNTVLDVINMTGYKPEIEQNWQRIPMDRFTPITDTTRTGQAIWFREIAERNRLYSYPAGDPERGAWANLPLTVDGRTIGAMTMSFPQPRDFSDEDKAFITSLAQTCAQALDRARLYEAEQTARAHAERVSTRITSSQNVTAALSRALTVREIVEVIIDQGAPAVGAVAGSIGLLAENGSTIDLVSMSGYSSEIRDQWAQIPLERSTPITDAARTGESIWLRSIEERNQRYNYPAPDPDGGAWSSIPLIVDGQTIGVMALSFGHAYEFSDEDKAFITLLAQNCAQALDRARLYESERTARTRAERTTARITSSQNVTTALSRALTVNEVAGVVINQGLTVMGVRAGLVALLTPDQTTLQVISAAGYPPEILQKWHEIPLAEPSIIADAIQTSQPIWVESLDKGKPYYNFPQLDTEHRAWATIPLIVDEHAIGGMILSFPDSRVFSEEDKAFIMLQVQKCAQAIDRARLYAETNEQRERFQVTLSSIGDAVIATDMDGCITFMNNIAEALTGWSKEEAIGNELQKIFHIINETTREVVENPVTKVIHDGAIVALANHTTLIAKDGGEIAIDDSGSPIRNEHGTIIGVILVFRDVSKRRKAEADLEATLERTFDLYEICRQIGLVYSPHDVLKALIASRYIRYVTQAAVLMFDKPWGATFPTHIEVLASLRQDIGLPGFAESGLLADSPLAALCSPNSAAFVEDARIDARLDATARATFVELEMASMMIFPLIARGECFGLLPLYCAAPHQWEQDDYRHIQVFIDQVSVAMDNVRLLSAESQARQEAEQANQLKIKFLAMISHELRTPLTSIKGFATTLLATDVTWDSESQHDFITIINEEADKLTDLIEQLLDLSRLQAGKLGIQPEPRHLNEIVGTAMAQLESITTHHQLAIHIPPNLPVVMADTQRIAQVLVNLAGNASKYAPEGSSIAISAVRQDSRVQIEVSDQGSGIPVEDRERVFEAFKQVESSLAQQAKGAGLGLAICKGLIEAHGGRIWIEGNDDGGTTVVFTLPVTTLHDR
ncbi:MAG: GAF domain-containing protein [Chloroflexota bacterium]